MDTSGLIDSLQAEGELLASTVTGDVWQAPVPPAPEWTLRDLVVHVGGVHRWAADVVATGSATVETAAGAAVGVDPGVPDLAAWFADGHAALVRVLRAAPPDLAAATFLPAESPRHFWARRQAHETAIHRIDAEVATGRPVSGVTAEFAQDGIAEILLGFGRRRGNRVEQPVTLGLDATDGPSWLVTFGGDRTQAQQVDALPHTDAAVAGPSAALYAWLWNRPAAVEVSSEDVARLWGGTVRVSWA